MNGAHPDRSDAGVREGISLDAVVLVMVTGITLYLNSYNQSIYTTPTLNAVAVGLLALYLVLDLLVRPLRALERRLYHGGKATLLGGIIALMVLWPTVTMIGLRHAPPRGTNAASYVHDTSINVEEATRFLLHGRDPYAETYFKTPLASFNWDSDHHYHRPNPALWETDTFPAQEVITVPFLLVAQATIGWFDERFIYLLALAATVALLVRLAPTPSRRLALVAGVALNPLWVPTFIYGQNDILVLAEIVAVLWLSQTGRWRLALMALAVGCATKQTTLILAPLYLWWLTLRLAPAWPERLGRLAALLPWLIVPFLVLVGPFALWNWPAFYDGNVAYVAGNAAHSYPIQGYNGWGAASFILWSGMVDGPNAYYPFWILEALAALPLALLLLRRMSATTALSQLLATYATVLFAIFYFSRFFHASYLASTISLLLVAFFMQRPQTQSDGETFLSFDVLVPLLLIPQIVDPPTNRANGIITALACGLLLAYLVVAAIAPWPLLRHRWSHRYAALSRTLVLTGLAYVTVFSRGFNSITDRLRWNVALFIHDTALQVQISGSALLQGRNPYTLSFWETPLRQFYITPARHTVAPANLPLFHNQHLPLEFLLGVPFQALFNALGAGFDERYLYLWALIATAGLAALLATGAVRQLTMLSLVLFSPLFTRSLLEGQDDILVLLTLMVMTLALHRRRQRTAALAAGFAVALKITAWPLVPLLIVYWLAHERSARSAAQQWRRGITQSLILLALPLTLSALPFMWWNAGALWSDALAYPLGLMRNAIPLEQSWGSGFRVLGFGKIALSLGWTDLNGNGYLGPLLALPAALGLYWGLLRRLWQAPSLGLLMSGYLVVLFVLEYLGRFMVDTSLGYLLLLAPLAFALPAPLPAAQPLPHLLPAAVSEPATEPALAV